jgi:hypothetical protein
MKKPEELYHELVDMTKATKEGKIYWKVEVQTTEANPPELKPVEKEDGILWTVDECYVSFYCKYKGKEFLMITYEMIKTAGERTHTTNLIFLPPMSIRVCNLHMLMPYAVQGSTVLANQIKTLWEMLLAMYKANPESVFFNVNPGTLVIEDEK